MVQLLFGVLIAASTPAPAPALIDDVAVIEQSASTNRPGFSISVTRTGETTVRVGVTSRSTTVATVLAAHLYADIDRAGSLADLPAGHCMKSASFGSTTSITYNGRRSPDLQCAQNTLEHALKSDAQAISRAALADKE
jgi:hypothetical protein